MENLAAGGLVGGVVVEVVRAFPFTATVGSGGVEGGVGAEGGERCERANTPCHTKLMTVVARVL